MSISPRWTRYYPLLAGLGLALGAAGPVMAQPAASSQPSAGAFVDLNRAIKAYLDGEGDTAAATFEQLLETDPQAEYRPTCMYYLGLIALEDGLRHSGAAQTANKAQDREAELRENNAARVSFTRAQTYFEQIVELTDPTAEMVQAALLLGIAQLARDDTPERQREALALAERAEETLQRYVSETEQGAIDRYGHFYLLVARYRLALTYRDMPGRAGAYLQRLNRAADNLQQALALAAADRDGGWLTATEYEDFKTVTTYYDALLALVRRDYQAARPRLVTVTERAAGTGLAQNAQGIIDKLDEVEASQPSRIQLPVPAPIGPWEFEGWLRIGNWYDSNVILLGKQTTLPRGYKRKDDYRLDLSADFNISRNISKSEAPWLVGESLTIGFGGGTANVWQPNIAQFDVNRYPARAYLNWQPIPDLYLGVQYEYSYTQLGHEPFITSQRITPVISKEWRGLGTDRNQRSLGRTDLYYTQDARNYLDRLTDFRLNRDGTYRALGLKHTFHLVQAKDLPYMQDYYAAESHQRERMSSLGEDWLKFDLGFEFREERTVGTEFELGGDAFIWGLHVPLPYRFAFELQGEFAWSDYTQPSIFDYDRKERMDFMQRYNLGVTYTFVARGELPQMRTLDVKLRTGIEMTFQNSNIWNRLGENIYEYDRAIYGAQLEIGF
jgi:hypothetical protein